MFSKECCSPCNYRLGYKRDSSEEQDYLLGGICLEKFVCIGA